MYLRFGGNGFIDTGVGQVLKKDGGENRSWSKDGSHPEAQWVSLLVREA